MLCWRRKKNPTTDYVNRFKVSDTYTLDIEIKDAPNIEIKEKKT